MKQLIIVLTIVFISAPSFKQDVTYKTHVYRHLKVEYGTLNGRLHGKFNVYNTFANETQLRLSGEFFQNNRVGTWRTYDINSDNHFLERIYSNNFFLKVSLPDSLKKQVSYTKNQQGLYDFIPKSEKDILLSKRVWSIIENKDQNPYLLKNSKFLNQLLQAIKTNEITAYSPGELQDLDQFTQEITYNELDMTHDIKSLELEAIEIKQDYYFSKSDVNLKIFTVGFALIVKSSSSKEPFKLCWFYFPDSQVFLSKIKVKSVIKYVNNMCDLFTFCDFSFRITKESNQYDRRIKDYKKSLSEQVKESDRILFDILANFSLQDSYMIRYLK